MIYGVIQMSRWPDEKNKEKKRDTFTVLDEIHPLCMKCAERVDKSMTLVTDTCVIRIMANSTDEPKPKKVGWLQGQAGTEYECDSFNDADVKFS